MPKPYVHKVQVSPSGKFVNDFPVDMLRYDCLYPNSEEDSGKILRCFGKNVFENNKPIITLERITWKTWEPTFERWKSFLWTVVGHEVI